MPELIMNIGSEFFASTEFKFKGKNSARTRMEYLQDLAAVMADEYCEEVELRGGDVSFFYVAESKVNVTRVTDFDLKAFDIKINARRFKKNNNRLAS